MTPLHDTFRVVVRLYAIVLVPRQPCTDWVADVRRRIGQSTQLEESRALYVVPEDVHIEGWVDENWEAAFEAHLSGVLPVRTTWPEQRTRDLFLRWYEVTLVTPSV